MTLLVYLWLAFKLWMLTDAIKRRVELGWYFLLAMPLGAVVYFFVVKARMFNIRNAPPTREVPKVDLAALRADVHDSPTFQHRVALGWALLEAGEPTEALAQFEAARSTHPNDKDGLLGLGSALLALDRPADAVPPLSEVVDRSFGFRDYRAVQTLVRALVDSGEAAAAVDLAQALARHSRRYEHMLALAELQHRLTLDADAIGTLRTLIEEFEGEPDYVRRRHGALATRARQLLRTLLPAE